MMVFSARRVLVPPVLALLLLTFNPLVRADEPKPSPQNTISLQLSEPVQAQKFPDSPKFWIADVVDRSGNAQPMLVLKSRGGIFLDRQPTLILRDALEQSLRTSGLLAADANGADLIVRLYVFHFGLAEGSGLDYFGKVEFSAMVKNAKTGQSQEVKATGTSIANGAARKKNVLKNVQADLEESLKDAIRNFLRSQQLKDAVAALRKGSDAAPVTASQQ